MNILVSRSRKLDKELGVCGEWWQRLMKTEKIAVLSVVVGSKRYTCWEVVRRLHACWERFEKCKCLSVYI